MYPNQSWPPVISPLGVYPCFRNAMRAKQGCYRDWQGHTHFVSIEPWRLAETKQIDLRRCSQKPEDYPLVKDEATREAKTNGE